MLGLGLAFDAQSGDRSGHQSLFRDGPPARFADAKGPIVDPIQSFLHLLDQFPFAVLDPQKEISIRFPGSPIRRIGEVPIILLTHVTACLSRFFHKVMKPSFKQPLKIKNLVLIHPKLLQENSDSPKGGEVFLNQINK
jgi:hypothetical protein